MSQRAPKFSIILAGGKGTRMRSAGLHKVCFPIDGKPAINRAIDVYRACGIRHHVVVVGAMAGQVIETVGREHEGVIFAYQAEQLGTAHAARQGARVLEAMARDAEVLIVAGDRFIEPFVLEQLFDVFYSRGCDLAFVAEPRVKDTQLGRVVLQPDGAVLGNVEVKDIRQREILGELRERAEADRLPSHQEIAERIRRSFSDAKAKLAFGPLWDTVAKEGRQPSRKELLDWIPPEMTCFSFVGTGDERIILSPSEIDATGTLNSSIYLVRFRVLDAVLTNLTRENAQREEYLPDMITMLAQARAGGERGGPTSQRRGAAGARPAEVSGGAEGGAVDSRGSAYRVEVLRVENPHAVMAFNDPAELLEIESYVQSKKRHAMIGELEPGPAYRSVSEWREAVECAARSAQEDRADPSRGKDNSKRRDQEEPRPLWEEMVRIYGEEQSFIHGRLEDYRQVLDLAAGIAGEKERVLLVRSPGRVNLMGRHVDHQGGHCNLMTIGYETIMAVHPRTDDRVYLYNWDSERFPDRHFSISELIADLPWEDWLSLVNSDKVSSLAVAAGGDWSQYIKAGILRLQKKFATRRLRGVDIFVKGNIPTAAGLSSSSALVVASAEAMVAVNELDTFPSQLVNLCGEGEWFVGTRGGSADHAAIKLGRKGKVVKVRFFDFAVDEIVPFPREYILVVCDSGLKAQKTTNAKNQFNHRVACYRIGLRLIKSHFPQYVPLIQHLRDVNRRNLGVPLSWIYKILLRLPERATREELAMMLPGEDLTGLFATHDPPEDGFYPVRGVVLYGLAESERSRMFADALREGRGETIGRLMSVSHDGDRVCRWEPDGTCRDWWSPVSNGYLLDLIEDLESGDTASVESAQLHWQPGSYHCSIPEIDRMVDIASSVPGVEGAQLAGAGLGGCMMVFAHRDAVEPLRRALVEGYYEPFGKPPSILLCRPIAGSGVLLAGR